MNQHITASRRSPIRPTPGPTRREDVVRLVDLKRRFGATPALDGISLTVRKGEILGIIGRSGAGKSTLIRCLNGLERPDSGEIFIEGREISRLGERDLQPLRRRIGMIFQHFNLLSAKTVEDNVALPLKIEGRPKAERLARAAELLDLVGLSEKAKAYPASLSGGQKQRVGIARALAARPALLLSDEATSALDPETTRSILALLKDINRQARPDHPADHPRDGSDPLDRRPRGGDRCRAHRRGRAGLVGLRRSAVGRSPQACLAASGRNCRPRLPARLLPATGAGDDPQRRCGRPGRAAARCCPILPPPCRAPFRLVHGGIDHIQHQPVGTLFFIAFPAAMRAHLRRGDHISESPPGAGGGAWPCRQSCLNFCCARSGKRC